MREFAITFKQSSFNIFVFSILGTTKACEGSFPSAEQINHPCGTTRYPPGRGGGKQPGGNGYGG